MPSTRRIAAIASLLVIWTSVSATESENLGIRALPAPAPLAIDGDVADWDLSGGVFVCGDVENLRGRLAVWYHLMYDAEHLYVLARWTDETPMNNPGSIAGDHGWIGDCLQMRTVLATADVAYRFDQEPSTQRTTHITAWRDRDGLDVVDLAWGMKFDQGGTKAGKERGAQQAFAVDDDGKGYVQELAIPWALIAPEGWSSTETASIIVTVEPNFGTETRYRISLKDLFRPGVTPNRVFTFRSANCWGFASLLTEGAVEPQPLRLADSRELPVRMVDGAPAVDWAALFEREAIEGFEPITFTMPEDGYVSLNISNGEGRVVRQLLTADFFTAGEHTVTWDGLGNVNHRIPGEVVAAGDYRWDAIWHQGLGLRLVGWAHNAGRTPFNSPGGNWGGDMGRPCAVIAHGKRVVLGWSGSEAGKAVVCTDLDGKVVWRHKRGGFGGARHLATDGSTVWVNDRQQGENVLYRLSLDKGEMAAWAGSDDAALDLIPLLTPFAPEGADGKPSLTGLDSHGDALLLSYADGDRVLVVDAADGSLRKAIEVEEPHDIEVGSDGSCYVLSGGGALLRLDLEEGSATSVLEDLNDAAGLAIDADGAIYVGLGAPDHQVLVLTPDGSEQRRIGRPGGRPERGAWVPDGMRAITALRIDSSGTLWVAELNGQPRRFVTWDAASGALEREFFGPTDYGALGGAISAVDPLVMVGNGCEWRLDADTGRATCVAVVHTGRWENARFGYGPDGREYLAVGGGWHGHHPVTIYERLGPGDWIARTKISALAEDPEHYKGETVKEHKYIGMRVWADADGDGQEQAGEVQEHVLGLGGWIDGWYMPMTPSMTFYGGRYRLAPVAWTDCGAPVYDPTESAEVAGFDAVAKGRGGMGAQRGMGSDDGRLMLYNGHYGKNDSDFQCWDNETGQLRWTYPNTYVGVHGGHRAPPAATGLIRAAYDVVGTGRLPDPIGDVFVIGTDKGEWHLLTGEGFYLSSLFQADPLKIRWPSDVIPGAIMDDTPPGMGAEDFGGSIAVTPEGQLYIQAGKTAFVNLRVVGLDQVAELGTGALSVSPDELDQAAKLREKLLQRSVGTRQAIVPKATVTFSGNLAKDFGRDLIRFEKSRADRTEVGIAYDDEMLYVGWQVSDATPWVNGADDPSQLFAMGDTVDLQLGTDPAADPDRKQPVLGDLRLSIGNFQGQPTAVCYRPVADGGQAKTYFSGTAKDGYTVQDVRVLEGVQITVTVDERSKRYVVEAAVPLASLGLSPTSQMTIGMDVGVTFSDPDGEDTVLRSYWNNQHTGLIADEVRELMIEPSRWGRITFE